MNEPVTTATIYLRKDGKTLDLRFKENRDFINLMRQPRFDRFMQWIANKLGSPIIMGSHLRWDYYLNPIQRIKQWWFFRKGTMVYGNGVGNFRGITTKL